MGINLKARIAEEKSKAAYTAVTELVGIVKKQELMLNAVSQMVYEMSHRQTAMEVVMDHILGLQGLKAKDIIEAYVAEEQTKAEESAKSNESTDAATEDVVKGKAVL